LFTTSEYISIFATRLLFLRRFKECIECELIAVKSFQAPYEVSSYRAAKLSDSFYSVKAELERKKEASMIQELLSQQANQFQSENAIIVLVYKQFTICNLAPEKFGTNSLRAGGVQSQRDRGAGNRQMYRCRL